MEGCLTFEQREALEDRRVRTTLRYVVDEEGMQPCRHAYHSKTLAELSPRLGGKDVVEELLYMLVSVGLVDEKFGMHSEDLPLAEGGNAVLVQRMRTQLYTLCGGLPDGARLEIGRLLY